MTAIEILQAASTLQRAARHLETVNHPELPSKARQALEDARCVLVAKREQLLQTKASQ